MQQSQNCASGSLPHSRSKNWKTLYEAALFELDTNKIAQRIVDAERAVINRMASLRMSEDGEAETKELMGALNVLRDLRKMSSDVEYPIRSEGGGFANPDK